MSLPRPQIVRGIPNPNTEMTEQVYGMRFAFMLSFLIILVDVTGHMWQQDGDYVSYCCIWTEN